MSRQCFRNSLVVAAAALLAGAATAEQPPAREPVVVTSQRMEADKLTDKVIFLGDVTVKKEDITITADTVIIFYDAPSRGIREMEALGNVVVRKEGRVALANRAIYSRDGETIVLTGDARIVEGENELSGERITLFVKDNRSIVEGGKVLFYQDKASPEKKGKEPSEGGTGVLPPLKRR